MGTCERILESSRGIEYLIFEIRGHEKSNKRDILPSDNVLNSTNELYLQNQFDSVKLISEFLGKEYSDEELQGLVDHASFSKMRQNPAINLEPILNQMYDSEEKKPDVKFIRKGQVGDWRNYMSNEISDKFDELSQKRWSDIGLTFDN